MKISALQEWRKAHGSAQVSQWFGFQAETRPRHGASIAAGKGGRRSGHLRQPPGSRAQVAFILSVDDRFQLGEREASILKVAICMSKVKLVKNRLK